MVEKLALQQESEASKESGIQFSANEKSDDQGYHVHQVAVGLNSRGLQNFVSLQYIIRNVALTSAISNPSFLSIY
jgi:hypothetical protein